MTVIRSKQNAQIKNWRKLQQAKHRRRSQTYLIDGSHMVQEAIRHQAEVIEVIMTESYQDSGELRAADLGDISRHLIQDDLAQELSELVRPQGLFAVVRQPRCRVEDLDLAKMTKVLVLDAIQDPGNLGTLIRTADAAAYDLVILGQGTVDLYNSKVLRATQGSIYQLPILSADLSTCLPQLQAQGLQVLATALNKEARPYQEVDFHPPTALILGNEGQGVQPELIELADQSIYIPMPGAAESLNVAVAGGILMFASLG